MTGIKKVFFLIKLVEMKKYVKNETIVHFPKHI